MKLKDVTRKEILKMALEAFHNSNEGHVIVVVDVRNGNVEVLSTPQDKHKTVILQLKEKDVAAGLDFDTLYKKHKYEICCNTFEVKERFPHLK